MNKVPCLVVVIKVTFFFSETKKMGGVDMMSHVNASLLRSPI
jgi:hypothetical protein